MKIKRLATGETVEEATLQAETGIRAFRVDEFAEAAAVEAAAAEAGKGKRRRMTLEEAQRAVETNGRVAQMRREGGYHYYDIVEAHKTSKEVRDKFFAEHFHEEEEVRCVLVGGAYFDVRAFATDEWLRVWVADGDGLVLPAGIFHRFFVPDTQDTDGGAVLMLRLFPSKPIWKSFERSDGANKTHPRRLAYVASMREEFSTALFREGLAVRRRALGEEYVNESLAAATDFNAVFQQMSTEVAYGKVWARPGLDMKTRSLLTVAMLCALGREHELRLHMRAAMENNGVSVAEMREVLLHVIIYCGFPAGRDGFRVAALAIQDLEKSRANKATAGAPTNKL